MLTVIAVGNLTDCYVKRVGKNPTTLRNVSRISTCSVCVSDSFLGFCQSIQLLIILKLFLNFKISKRKGRQKRKRLNTIDLGWGAILALQGWGGGCYEFGENIGYRLRSCLKGNYIYNLYE